MKHLTRNNPFNQIYGKVLAMALIVLVTITITLLSALTANEQAMKRESTKPAPLQGEIVLSLDQALNLSLACGDYRRVNVDWAEVA